MMNNMTTPFIMKTIISLLILTVVYTTVQSQNNSLQFDGIDDYVNLENNFSFEHTDSFSIEAWIKVDLQGEFQQIISKLGIENGEFRGWGFQVTNTGFISGYIATVFDVDFIYVRGTTVLNDGLWHHAAMTYDGIDEILLYLDGEIEPIGFSDNSGTLTTILNTTDTHIGNYHGNGSQGEYAVGNIDELRVWNGVRSQPEIQANYQTELSGTEANLIGYYKFDDNASDCDVRDCSPTEAHGTRFGNNGANNLPQFDPDVPVITDVACGAIENCKLGTEDYKAVTIHLLPNPANDFVLVSGYDVAGSSVKIHNLLGVEISKINLTTNTMDLSGLASGMYFVTLEIDGTQFVKRIIKE